jgi:hypothetical protein
MLQLNAVFIGVIDVIESCASALCGGLLPIFSLVAFLLKLISIVLIIFYCVITLYVEVKYHKGGNI